MTKDAISRKKCEKCLFFTLFRNDEQVSPTTGSRLMGWWADGSFSLSLDTTIGSGNSYHNTWLWVKNVDMYQPRVYADDMVTGILCIFLDLLALTAELIDVWLMLLEAMEQAVNTLATDFVVHVFHRQFPHLLLVSTNSWGDMKPR